MAVLHKKRNANTKKRARLMLGMAACVFAPTALAVWYLTALLAKRQPPAALAYGALAAPAAAAACRSPSIPLFRTALRVYNTRKHSAPAAAAASAP